MFPDTDFQATVDTIKGDETNTYVIQILCTDYIGMNYIVKMCKPVTAILNSGRFWVSGYSIIEAGASSRLFNLSLLYEFDARQIQIICLKSELDA